MNKGITNIIDYKYLLINKYKKLGLSEVETMLILVMEQLLEEGNELVTADLLALKMNLSLKEIDAILVKLLNRKFLDYDTSKKQMKTTLKPLKERLYKELELDLNVSLKQETIKETKDTIKSLNEHFEASLGRKLTPLEKDKIKEWIDIGYKEDVILCSLDEALAANKKTIRSVDKILMKKATRDDMEKEGYSTISDRWKKSVEETIDIAKDTWSK